MVTDIAKEFAKNLAQLGENLSIEDLNTAIESLVLYRSQLKEAKEEEARKKREEEKRKEEIKNRLKEKERIKNVTSMDLPLDWENVFSSSEIAAGVHAESVSDALILCLNALGRVDIEYISEITGSTCKEAINTLKGSIYQNPETWNECFYKGWETADEYLSGNMVEKWTAAMKANMKYNGYFADNLAAIQKVLPKAVSADEIYITLGTPWIPPQYIDSFIVRLIEGHDGKSTLKYIENFVVRHNEETGSWEIPDKNRYNYNRYSQKATYTYGTKRINALEIIEKTLNCNPVVIRDEIKVGTKIKKQINKNETLLAQQKQKQIVEHFQKWIKNNPELRHELETIYERKFCSICQRHYDGSFLTFPQMNKSVSLYDYQKNAVARIILSPNTLLAHDVGAGKTYVMTAAGMEMKRMGVSNKNLYVVPNNLTGQWKKIFLEMYPGAKLLVVEPKRFTPEKRTAVLEAIRDGDYDGIIMAYSCFDNIGISKKEEEEELNKVLQKLEESEANGFKKTRATSAKIRAVKNALHKVITSAASADDIYFDELGINTLFLDEAHNYKNITNDTSFASSVRGVTNKGSKKCDLMMKKVRCVQKQNNGRGVVFATGTPVTNSVTDLYTIQKYLQSGTLAMLGIDNFRAWCGMFAETKEEFEVDVDTSEYRMVTRFSKFHNLPELTSLVSAIADFHGADSSAGIPEFGGYDDALIGKTTEFEQYLADISKRVESIRKGVVSRDDDNMLKVTVDGRKAALDMRLADPKTPFYYNSKVYTCAENIFDIYMKTSAQKSTQLVFCDTSTPKPGFNIYDETARLLTGMGIPREEIAFVHDASTEKARENLFAKVRRGEIRVLFGSTFKLGLGVNIQNKLTALHHLDVPWRPADMVQREGRILRQGNTNKKVSIYRYITEGSFDAYSWQLLETKQKFICDLLSGSMSERSGSEISDTVLNYGEVKALAVGNPLIKKRFEAANELSKFISLQRKATEEKQESEAQLASMPGKIKENRDSKKNALADIRFLQNNPVEYSKEERTAIREKLHEAVKGNVLRPQETEFMNYRGFRVVLPANMTEEKPFVWLVNNGRYYVETGNTAAGGLIRIDNRIDGLAEYAEKLDAKYTELCASQKNLRTAIDNSVSYSGDIERCRALVEKYDKELGVDKE